MRQVAETLEPHHLCGYLYDVANLFMGFYQNCPVLKAETEAQRRSRLQAVRSHRPGARARARAARNRGAGAHVSAR